MFIPDLVLMLYFVFTGSGELSSKASPMSLWFEYAPITTIITGVVAVLLVLTMLAIRASAKVPHPANVNRRDWQQ